MRILWTDTCKHHWLLFASTVKQDTACVFVNEKDIIPEYYNKFLHHRETAMLKAEYQLTLCTKEKIRMTLKEQCIYSFKLLLIIAILTE